MRISILFGKREKFKKIYFILIVISDSVESFFPEKMRSESQNFPTHNKQNTWENFMMHFAFSLEKRTLVRTYVYIHKL